MRKLAILDKKSERTANRAFVDHFVAARLFIADRFDEGRPLARVAHEAPLRHWPRLIKWIEENREFLRARAGVENLALIWREEGESTDFLLSEGKPLAAAKELLEDCDSKTLLWLFQI